MGLDMYLYGAKHTFDPETYAGRIKLEEVARWRKQNAIHKWMVENVQDNVDNCAMYYVSKETLKELLVICNKILEKPTAKNAMELLPTQGGFFFGGTDLNLDYELDYYLEGIKYTVEVFKELFKLEYDYYMYQSSW